MLERTTPLQDNIRDEKRAKINKKATLDKNEGTLI